LLTLLYYTNRNVKIFKREKLDETLLKIKEIHTNMSVKIRLVERTGLIYSTDSSTEVSHFGRNFIPITYIITQKYV